MRNVRCLGRVWLPSAFVVAVVWLWAGLPGQAQETGLPKMGLLADEKYRVPQKEIADIVLAPWHKNVALNNLSPDGKKFLITKNEGLPTVDRQGRPCVYLGELAFDPVAHRAHQMYVKSAAGFELFDPLTKRKVPVQLPAKARVSDPQWSPDGSQLAFFAHFPEATHIYIANANTGQSRRITDTPVLATFVNNFHWTRDGSRIQTILLPDDGTKKMADGPAEGPKVRVSLEGKFPTRTFRFLLETPHDMELLEHLTTGQLAFIDVYDGRVKKVGAPSMFRTVAMAPSGEQFRVTVMKKPFSYYVPASSFGSQEGLWDLEGKNLFTLAERDLKISEGGQGGGGGKGGPKKGGNVAGAAGKRDLAWRPDGKGMSFLELEPTPASGEKKNLNDRVMQWLPPYGPKDVAVVYETPLRITSVQYSDDCQWIFLVQTVENQRQIVAVNLGETNKSYLIQKGPAAPTPKEPDKGDGDGKDGGDDDVMPSPFTPVDEEFPFQGYDHEQQPKGKFGGAGAGAGEPTLLTRSSRGEGKIVRISSAGEVYVAGTDRSGGAVSPRAYIDKVEVKTGKRTRIFAGRGDLLETIDTVDGDDVKVVYTTRQKKDVVPDCYRNNLADGKTEKLTENVDYTPGFSKKTKTERFQVTREDGFKFWVKVTRPADAKGRLPAMFWIYPKEYASQTAYDNANGGGGGKGGGGKGGADGGRFTAPGIRSMSLLCLLGYAVVEPDVPIVGPAGKMNDNYVPDLKSSLKAVVEELDKRELVDRDRLAIGGHSYGAFSTANAMVHTTYFKAGIAGDGCYNRTLTPMTFQTEKRTLWTAQQTYLDMSPLLRADKMSGALLMYHGMDDANVGTNPINADHLYMALRGLGKPAALYMYPYEGHGPAGRESILDQWARWTAWLDLHVMNAVKKKA